MYLVFALTPFSTRRLENPVHVKNLDMMKLTISSSLPSISLSMRTFLKAALMMDRNMDMRMKIIIITKLKKNRGPKIGWYLFIS